MFTSGNNVQLDQKERKSMKILVKSSLKLLIRTKAFWFFLILMPVLSTFILKIKFDSSAAYQDSYAEEVLELESADSKVAYYGGKGEYVVKVYDAAADSYSKEFLSRLSKSGMFLICRADVSDINITDEFLEERLDADGFQDRMGSVLYIHPDFMEQVWEGDASQSLTMYLLSDDERSDALESLIELTLSRMVSLRGSIPAFQSSDEAQPGGVIDALNVGDQLMPEKEIITVAGTQGRNLTTEQTNQKTQIGYSFAFMTLCFVFCGIFVAHSSIREQKNGVYTRIRLTRTTTIQYFLSKFIVSFIISVMITGVLAICSLALDSGDLGMSKPVFLGIIFLMGLIFGSLSMLIGTLMGDVMSANVAAFLLWCMSALLSGLYFPLNYTSTALKALSFMMPQRWFLEGTEMVFVGDNNVIPMLLCITSAYLAVILSLGGLGLKLRRSDEWGNS